MYYRSLLEDSYKDNIQKSLVVNSKANTALFVLEIGIASHDGVI